jgi:hypothetical protein
MSVLLLAAKPSPTPEKQKVFLLITERLYIITDPTGVEGMLK